MLSRPPAGSQADVQRATHPRKPPGRYESRHPGVAISRITRTRIGSATERQTPIWSIIDFRGDDTNADRFAADLSRALDPEGHWYTDFSVGADLVVVFPGRVFRYRSGDPTGRAEVEAYGRSMGIPAAQLD